MNLKKVKRHILEERIALLEKGDQRKNYVKENLKEMKTELKRRKGNENNYIR